MNRDTDEPHAQRSRRSEGLAGRFAGRRWGRGRGACRDQETDQRADGEPKVHAIDSLIAKAPVRNRNAIAMRLPSGNRFKTSWGTESMQRTELSLRHWNWSST
jgi:hypothetical protein